jgi:uncharacterized iron-regulated membrane protein
MRKWHRWLVIFSAVFLVWIAATGVVGQVLSLAGEEEHHKGQAVAAVQAAAPAEGDRPAAKPKRKQDLRHFIIDLHSGEYFGPVGKVVSVLMGVALLFFALSGMWMYLDMFRKRKQIGRKGLFWK